MHDVIRQDQVESESVDRLRDYISKATKEHLAAGRRLLTEELERRTGSAPPIRHKLMPEGWYEPLDVGIRWPVKVLHASGIETCQACEGGPGHSYHEPTIDLWAAGSGGAEGFAALDALRRYRIEVTSVALYWDVEDGLPHSSLWRVTLKRSWPERAADVPNFVHAHIAWGE